MIRLREVVDGANCQVETTPHLRKTFAAPFAGPFGVCCVAGDKLRIVMSSIMRRRRGVSRLWGCNPETLADRTSLSADAEIGRRLWQFGLS